MSSQFDPILAAAMPYSLQAALTKVPDDVPMGRATRATCGAHCSSCGTRLNQLNSEFYCGTCSPNCIRHVNCPAVRRKP